MPDQGGYERIATVKAIDIEYDITKDWGKPTHFDIFMTIAFNTGAEYDKDQIIAGRVKKELDPKNPKAWGSAFKVKLFFETVLNKQGLKLNNDYKIPDQWMDDAIGKEYMICEYPTTSEKRNGGYFWNTYDIVAPTDSPRGTLKEKVLQQHRNGWLRKYNPDYYNNNKDQDTSANTSKDDKASYNLDI